MTPVEKLTDETRNGYPVKEGHRLAKSPITGTVYVVTRWEDRGEDKIKALEKREAEPSEIPEEVEFDV